MSSQVENGARRAVRRTSLSGQVATLLGQYLEDGGVAPGDSLPPMRELAERFDVSVPVVREAIAQLAGQGRLQRSQGRPTVARMPSAADLQAVFGSTLGHRADRSSQLLDYRRAVQVGAVRLATQRATPADVDRLRDQLTDWTGDDVSAERMRRAEVGLHRMIAEIAGNELLLLNLATADAMLLQVDITAWQRRLLLPYTTDELIEDYHALIRAVAARRRRRAEKLLHDHLDRWNRDFCYQ